MGVRTGDLGRSPFRKVPALLKQRQAWLSRLVFRAPIMLYRVGLGKLLGHEFLLLTHAGRRTGRVHEDGAEGAPP